MAYCQEPGPKTGVSCMLSPGHRGYHDAQDRNVPSWPTVERWLTTCPAVHEPTGTPCERSPGHDWLHSGYNGEPGNDFEWADEGAESPSESLAVTVAGDYTNDREIAVLAAIVGLLGSLDDDTRDRAVRYLWDRYNH